MNRRVGRKKNIYEKIGMQPHGATDSASDFGSEGWGFESLWGCVFEKEEKGIIKDGGELTLKEKILKW